MKRGLILLVFVFLLAVGFVSALDIPLKVPDFPNPIEEPSVNMPSLEKIPSESKEPAVECGSVPTSGCTISQSTTFTPGNYVLSTGIWITADNIVLDCNGAVIIYDVVNGGYPLGLDFDNLNNVIIKNCVFKDFEQSISFYDSSNIHIENNSILGGFIGIHAHNSEDVFIINNFLNSTQERASGAILLTKTNNSKVEENLVDSWTGFGVEILIASGIEIINNTINNSLGGIREYDNYPYDKKYGDILIKNNFVGNSYGSWISYAYFGDTEMMISNVENITISGNIFVNNSGGLYLAGDKIHVFNNTITYQETQGDIGEYPEGIRLNGPVKDVEIYENYIESLSNGRSGIRANYNYNDINGQKAEGVKIYNNKIKGNIYCGIFVRNNTLGFEIKNNTLIENTYGLCLEFGGGHVVTNNKITDNGYGVEFYSTPNNKVFFNKIYLNNIFNVIGLEPVEISYEGYGNYWGHTSPPCFSPGVDSNIFEVVDSYPLCEPPPENFGLVNLPVFGWYFMGLSLIPFDTTPSEVFKSILGKYEVVQYYVNGQNKIYKPSNPPYLNTLTSIEPWYGYWLKYNYWGNSDLVIVGDAVTGCHGLSLQSTPVSQHWVGYWLEDETDTATALSSIAGNYEWVRTYENGAWKSYLPSLPQFSDLTTMKPGQGYLIKMTNADTIDYICG